MTPARTTGGAPVDRVEAAAYTIPTDAPEADGTLEWDSTTIVVVSVGGGGELGLGYTYAHAAAATLITATLAPLVQGRDALQVEACWSSMNAAVRNIGRPGLASHAISAVDAALWDLKARLLDLPLVTLLGARRDSVPVYGSGGFLTYDDDRLREQLSGWAEQGIPAMKMKVGPDLKRDRERVRAARAALGERAELYVDANGALTRKQALAQAWAFAEHGVTWFEEPVSSDDLSGLRLLRDGAPPGMEITAGEYGYDHLYFRRMLEAGAVDVLMPDATRCGGITGFRRAAALGEAFATPISAHTAPALHLHVCCASPGVRHLEWFHDHVRIERRLFDGAPVVVDGRLSPDLGRPGIGLELRASDAAPFAVPGS